MRTLNVRLAAIVAAILVVFGVGVYFLHGYQVKRNASMFKREAARAQDRAREAASQKDAAAERDANKESVKNMGWYVRLRPDDVEVMAEFATLLADQAKDSRSYLSAIGWLERVLRQDPSQKKIRRKLIDMYMGGQRYSDAKEHLLQMQAEDDKDAELWDMLGRCYDETNEFDKAVEYYKKAVELDPTCVQVYPRLAKALRFHCGNPKEADQWIDKLVKVNPKSDQAHYLRGSFLITYNAADEAMKEAMKSLELKKDNRDGLWLATQCCLAKGQIDDARKYAALSIKLYPNNVLMYTSLADVELRAGNKDKAVAALEDGLKATSRNTHLLWSLANVQIDVNRPKDAEKTTAELQAAEYPRTLVEYLKARIEFIQGHWLAARQGFEKVRSTLLLWPGLLKQTDLWIAQCYGQLGNRDKQLEAYRNALHTDKFYMPARVGEIETMMASGDFENARKKYEELTRLGKMGSSTMIPYARMLVEENSRQPASKQNWKQAMQVLDEAEKINPDSIEVPILRAQILVAQDKLTDAEALLERARAENPTQSALWIVQASLAERQKNWAKAERLLGEAQQTWGDTVPQRLALAQYMAQRYGMEKKGVERIHNQAENVDRFNEARRLELWSGLVNIAVQMGDTEQARKLCRRIADKEPDNVRVRFLMFEQAVRANDLPGMEKALKEVERAAGAGAFSMYGQAVILTVRAKDKKGEEQKHMLEQALEILDQAREVRPNWSRIPLLMAGIYDQQNKTDAALKHFQEAIALGEQDPAAIQRTVELLFSKQQFDAADRLLHKLDERKVAFSTDMSRAGAEAAYREGDFDRALELARKSATAESKNYKAHIWLATMLSMVSRRARGEGQATKSEELFNEAERALRRAVKVDPKLPAAWVTLVQLFTSRDREDDAEKTIAEATKNLPAKDAPLAIAQCYEAMGKLDIAAGKYEAALAAGRQDPQIMCTVANFYCRHGKAAPAEAILRQIIDGKVKVQEADVIWARRELAQVYFGRGGYKNQQKARELIELNLASAETSIQDRRMKAVIDARDPERSRRDQAMRVLENLDDERSASPDDRLRLALMYNDAGAWVQAGTVFRKLISAVGNDPRYLEPYVVALLEHGDVDTADAYLGRLETALPNSIKSVGLRAKVLVAKKEGDKAFDLLKGFVDKADARPTDRNVRLLQVSGQLGLLAKQLAKSDQKDLAKRYGQQAEAFLRELVGKTRGQELLLVDFLADQGRFDEAIDLLNKTVQDSNPVALHRVLWVFLRNDKIGKDQLRRLDGCVQVGLKQFDRPIDILLFAAEVATRLGNYVGAEGYYREILVKIPNNGKALNNLAVLLAMQGIKLDEALKFVNQATEASGRVGAMLDSRATVYLAMGATEKALADLTEALADAETPVRLFHQAQAYEQAGRGADAVAAMDKALRKGLTKEMLHPLEAPTFEKLKRLR